MSLAHSVSQVHQTLSYSVLPFWVMWFKLGLVKHLLKHHYFLVIKNVEIKEAMILPSWSQPCGEADDSTAQVTGLERAAHLVSPLSSHRRAVTHLDLRSGSASWWLLDSAGWGSAPSSWAGLWLGDSGSVCLRLLCHLSLQLDSFGVCTKTVSLFCPLEVPACFCSLL